MRAGRAALGAALSVGVLASPAPVGAATLETKPSKRCYGTSDTVSLTGGGFTPSRSVNIRRDGRLLNRRDGKVEPIETGPAGRVAVVATVPDLERKVQISTYTAIDRADRSIRASMRVRLSDLRVRINPEDAAANRPRKINARGFTARGKALYGHVVRKGKSRTFRVGRLRGRCKTTSGVRRLFGRNAVRGTYRVQFDAFKDYEADRVQRVRYSITIRRPTRSAATGLAAVSRSAETAARR